MPMPRHWGFQVTSWHGNPLYYRAALGRLVHCTLKTGHMERPAMGPYTLQITVPDRPEYGTQYLDQHQLTWVEDAPYLSRPSYARLRLFFYSLCPRLHNRWINRSLSCSL